MSSNDTAWRELEGSEVGSLLRQIYGRPSPLVNYPKPKPKPADQKPPPTFIPGGGRPDAADPRAKTRREAKVAAPKFRRRQLSEPSMQVHRPARRPQEVIQHELDDTNMRITHYRPAATREISEAEKQRLSDVFAYKGGKALPEELTVPAGDTPEEAAAREAEQKRVARVIAKRRGADPSPETIGAETLHPREALRQQIIGEIDERRAWLKSMKGMNAPDDLQAQQRVRLEISDRLKEIVALNEQDKRRHR